MERISKSPVSAAIAAPRPWDARLGRRLVTPLKDSWVTPNHLTTVRLLVGLAGGGWPSLPGTWGWTNLAALLVIVSNFLDHTDGELARISGKTSRIGHLYDLASDALVTILLFCCIGVGVAATAPGSCRSGRRRADGRRGRLRGRTDLLSAHAHRGHCWASPAASKRSLAGFETEDVLYLLPLVTLFSGLTPFLLAAASARRCSRCWWSSTSSGCSPQCGGSRFGGAPGARRMPPPMSALDATLQASLGGLDHGPLRRQYREQGSFVYVPDFLPRGVHRAAGRRRSLPSRRWSIAISCRATSRAAASVATASMSSRPSSRSCIARRRCCRWLECADR